MEETLGQMSRFVATNDRLRRHLFDVALRLHTMVEELEDPETTRQRTRDMLAGLIEELDTLLRDSALAILALTSEGSRTILVDDSGLDGHARAMDRDSADRISAAVAQGDPRAVPRQ
ncbi:hypothetical protein ACQPW1_10575 [Nocardia sp. CA-128927]|uniref:hypothetical protein n=1 Tax=Nocardia sp. CA-128927 TaxID=3239975 RepID=UPI003D95E381